MTNLIDLMQIDPPTTHEFTGKVRGVLGVRYGLASDLSRVVRFGGGSFAPGLDNVLTVGAMQAVVAGASVIEQDGEWRTVRPNYGFRRPWDANGSKGDVPHKTALLIEAALVEVAARFGEQYPQAFSELGFNDTYSTGPSVRSAIERMTNAMSVLADYDYLHLRVAEGTYEVRPTPAPDGLAVEARWTAVDRDYCNDAQMQHPQPQPVVGGVFHGDTLVGYALDCREYRYGQPDAYRGPFLVPTTQARVEVKR